MTTRKSTGGGVARAGEKGGGDIVWCYKRRILLRKIGLSPPTLC